jgi:hypothetical protein
MKTVEHRDVVSNFVASVRTYCVTVEHATDLLPHQLAQQIAIALADLYSHALQLPDIEPCEEYIQPERVELPSAIQSALARLSILPPENGTESEYMGDTLNSVLLTDDLGDIYRDLKSALSPYDSGNDCAQSNAVWEWKFSFETHWREHLVHALYTLDRLLRQNMLPEEP